MSSQKTLDFNRNVHDLVTEYPEVADIMAGLGFSEITKKAMLNSVGRMMTIPKGAKMKSIPLADIVQAFRDRGFDVINAGEEAAEKKEITTEKFISDTRTEQIKSYLRRLSGGEDLESVRADFVKEFGEVEASEIMRAEQELLKEGTPLTEVQQLCDVHSALFPGATREEKIANAEKEVAASVQRQASFQQGKEGEKAERAAELEAIDGHPLQTFTRENEALSGLLEEIKSAIARKEDVSLLLSTIRELSVHYAKKGDLLYPHLKVKYDVTGPSEVMWTVDDEIRDELRALDDEKERGEWWTTRLENVLKRAEEMIYKEQNILFPICAVNFTEDEWKKIYRDSKDYSVCFGVENAVWADAKQSEETRQTALGEEIVMPGGHMNVEQMTAMLNTIPLELTFVDADDVNRFFNEGPKVFKHPGMAIDRDVTEEEIKDALTCLDGYEKQFRKDDIIFHAGDTVTEIGLVETGSVNIVVNFYWGNSHIFGHVGEGDIFAQNYAAIPGKELICDIVAAEDTKVLLIDLGKLLTMCKQNCPYHTRLIHNLVRISAMKSLALSDRMMHTASKSIRERLLSYLSGQALEHGSAHFAIPFSRQQLADYLGVDRSAMSNELGKMQKDGLIAYRKDEFTLMSVDR